MALYDVVAPCSFMADGRAVHYRQPGAEPVEIAQSDAAPLVEVGVLVPHGVIVPPALQLGFVEDAAAETAAAGDESATAATDRRRRRRPPKR